MMSPTPPALPTWLLVKCGAPSSLIGDVQEQLQRGRSSAWYWRQALRASAAHTYHNVRDYKLRAAMALLVACTFWMLYDVVAAELVQRFKLVNWIPDTFTLGAQVRLMVPLYMPALGMGWIVGRLYRGSYQAAAVLVVAVYVLLTVPPGGVFLLPFPHPPAPWLEVWRASMSAQIMASPTPALVELILTMSVTFFCVLAAGLSVSSPDVPAAV